MDRRSFLGTAALPAIRGDKAWNHTFRECVILELMGHVEIAGVMTDVVIGGCPFFRIDIPNEDGRSYKLTKHFAPNSIYAFRVVDQSTMMIHPSIRPRRWNNGWEAHDQRFDPYTGNVAVVTLNGVDVCAECHDRESLRNG